MGQGVVRWGQVGPGGARGQRGSFSITRGGHGVRWGRRGVYMKMGAHNTKIVGYFEVHVYKGLDLFLPSCVLSQWNKPNNYS